LGLVIEEIGPDRLCEYAEIPIAFEVKSILKVELIDGGLGGIRLKEERIEPAYVKDYDSYEDGGPEHWPRTFNLDNFGFFLGLDGERLVGAAAVAYNTPDIHMLAGRRDLAVLWDIRVRPGARRRGIGTALFACAADWARKKGCRQLKIETQNVNVPACRFYASQGSRLGEVNRYGYVRYPAVAHEVMLIWYLDL
jgi:GNAT superfamily N-acetyltransferase